MKTSVHRVNTTPVKIQTPQFGYGKSGSKQTGKIDNKVKAETVHKSKSKFGKARTSEEPQSTKFKLPVKKDRSMYLRYETDYTGKKL